MKKRLRNKPLCILIMISILVLGIYCEDLHSDLSFSYAFGGFHSASLQSTDHISGAQVYCERDSFRLLEESVLIRQSIRTLAGVRIHPCILTALFLIYAYLLSLSVRIFHLCIEGYPNQYDRRTLEYIHHNDGKKSHIC